MVRTAMRVALVPNATLLQPNCAAILSSKALRKDAIRSSLPVMSDTACKVKQPILRQHDDNNNFFTITNLTFHHMCQVCVAQVLSPQAGLL